MYVLPWGQMSYWGATVITNFFSAIPFIGKDLVELIWGSFTVDNATLNRFFALHFLMPFVIFGLMLMHLMALHTHGSNNPLGISSNNDRIFFYPYFIFKDIVGLIVFIIFLGFFVFYYPNLLGHSDNYIEANPLVTPNHIVPEWYYLFAYCILRSIPSKLGGVIALVLSILILLILPFISNNKTTRTSQFRPALRFAFWLFCSNFIILMYLGSQSVEEPFITLGQICTTLYFSYFLIILTFIDYLESKLFLNQQIKVINGNYSNFNNKC